MSGDPLWRELGAVEATSAESAIRAHLDANKAAVGSHVFIAVPERSAGKIQAEVRQERRVRLGATDEERLNEGVA